jgi:succinoglycan biosynthesis transport protein ExoP
MPEQNTPTFDFKYYAEIILRKKYLALSVALAVLSIFTWGSFFIPKVYEATSTVLIEKSSILDPLIRGVGVSNSNRDRLSNLKDSIASRSLLGKVLKKLGMIGSTQNPEDFVGLIDAIRSGVAVSFHGAQETGSDFFAVSYRGRDPKMVADLVNTLVREYIDETLGYRKSDAYGAYEFIQAQLLEYKKSLEESDRAIREFREKNPNIVPQNENTLLTRLEGFQTSKIDAELKLKELTRKKENLQKQLSGEKELAVTMVTSEGSPQGRLAYLNNQLVLLMTKFTDNYPEVIKVKSEIEELKKQIAQAKTSSIQSAGSETATMNPIYQQLRAELARTDAEVESLRARVTELSRQQREGENTLGRMPKEQEEWTKLQRDRNVYQKIYDELLQRLENAKVSKDLEGTNKSGPFKILDAAIVPSLPIKPNRLQIIGLGILLGILSGIGVVLGLDYLNHSFKDESTIESKLKLSVLATIPRIITEEDKLSEQRRDKKVFTAACAYLCIIGLVLVHEFLFRYMGVKIVDF